MNNGIMWEGLLSIVITVVSGVLVYLAGEILNTVWLHPLQEYKMMKQKIAYELSYDAQYYGNVIQNSGPDSTDEDLHRKYLEASNRIRIIACELEGYIETLSWFKLGIPRKKNLKDACSLLFLLSNSLFTGTYDVVEASLRNQNCALKIKKKLGLYGSKKEKYNEI